MDKKLNNFIELSDDVENYIESLDGNDKYYFNKIEKSMVVENLRNNVIFTFYYFWSFPDGLPNLCMVQILDKNKGENLIVPYSIITDELDNLFHFSMNKVLSKECNKGGSIQSIKGKYIFDENQNIH